MANGVGQAGLMGALSGAGKGAQLGSIIPGIGTAVGAAGGAILGATGAAIGQNRATKSQDVPFVDPMDIKRRAELEQVRKSLSVGTDPATQLGIQSAESIARGAQNPIVRSTGGDVSATLDGLLKTQRNANSGANDAIAQGQQRIPYFDNALGTMVDAIGQRKLELALLNRAQRTAESAQARTDNNVSGNAVLATQGGAQTIPEALQSLNINLPNIFNGGGGAQFIPTSPNSFNPNATMDPMLGAQVPINPTSIFTNAGIGSQNTINGIAGPITF